MKYFKMADIGFAIKQSEKQLEVGTYLEAFEINEREFGEIDDKVLVKVVERDAKKLNRIKDYGSYVLCSNGKKNVIFAPYGRYYQAVTFCHQEWYESECCLNIVSGVASEEYFTINKLFSISGIHSSFLSRGALVLHASYIMTPKGAILFTAPSQTGKSTQARLWEQVNGAEVINGDRVLIRKNEDKWYAYGYSVCGSSDICKNKQALICAIVVLEQGKQNLVKQISTIEKYRALLLATALYSWDVKQVNMADEIITKIIKETTIVKLVCRPDEDAVHVLENYLNEVEKCH